MLNEDTPKEIHRPSLVKISGAKYTLEAKHVQITKIGCANYMEMVSISILLFLSSAGLVIMLDYYRMINKGQLMILLLGFTAAVLSLSPAIIHNFGIES